MSIRLERKALFSTKVHLLVTDQRRLLELGYTGTPGRRGWATYADFDSAAEAEEGRRLVVQALRREGYREVEWVQELAVDEFISQLRAGDV
ncbi:MAG: hypothetical protein WAS07_02320 [Micropruina sp.]